VIQAAIFYLFAAIIVLSALMVILARNPVHSVLWLILAFFNASGLFLVIGAEFLAMILAIVYVGAVAVLFLFVVMMLDIDFTSLRAGFAHYLPFGLLLGVILAVELATVGFYWRFSDLALDARAFPAPGADSGLSNIQSLGVLIYTDYVYIFELSGMVLLVAMIGAIVLSLRQRPGVRRQKVSEQNARTSENVIQNTRPVVGEGVDTSGGVQ